MALTDHSQIFGSVHEAGINRVVRHIQRQRPSLFNYATKAFAGREELFCEPIEPDNRVLEAGNPLFGEQDPIPVLGTPSEHPLGLNWCLQFTHVEVDFHPNNVVVLPPELHPLELQRFVVRLRACFALDCPSKDFFEKELPVIEEIVTKERDLTRRFDDLTIGPRKDDDKDKRPESDDKGKEKDKDPPETIVPPLTRERLRCFCVQVIAVAHFEWGTVGDPKRQWVKTRLDGLEIVDIGPEPLESTLECYVRTVLRLGILPRLTISVESMVMDITKALRERGIVIGKSVRLEPSSVPADVPDNPSVEDDQLKVFVDLIVEDF